MSKVNRNKPFLLAVLAACFVSSLLFFTSLDNKLFDLFLRLLPPLAENEKVFVLTLDDASMEYAGGFPFRREVMADVIILLKELGVESIVFDLSYLDESAERFCPQYAVDLFIQHLNSGIADLDSAVSVIPLLGRDVDEYFAKALAFSGSSWLTLTMLPPEVFIDDDVITNKETDRYLAEFLAAQDVFSYGDTKTPSSAAVIPSIQKLLSRARGAGFVNAGPDSDGIRRRVNLMWKYQDNYYKQLTLAAIQEKLGYDTVSITNKAITLNLNDGGTLRIPRAQDGTVLYRWPKKSFNEYNTMSLVSLIQHIMLEPVLAQNISLMNDLGLFFYWDGGIEGDGIEDDGIEGAESELLTPWEYYIKAEEIKNKELAGNFAASDNWLLARQLFFYTFKTFLNGHYEDAVLADVEEYPETADLVRELFDVCREQFERLLVIRKDAEVLYGSFSVIGSDATSMTDHSIVPFEKNYPNVGSYAVLANMLLAGDFLVDVHWLIPAIIAFLYSLLTGFIVTRLDTHLSILTGLFGIILLCALFGFFFVVSKIYLGLAVPLAAVTLSFLTIMISKFLTTSHEKAFLHNAFSRYLAPEIITELINDPVKLNLGGEKREMTAIFTDIKGFSTISEQLDPAHLVRLLNRYLTLMSNIVMENMGTIDKYIGDAIVAFYGAPIFRADHAALACRSAIAMKAAERELNKTVLEEGLSPVKIFTRIGINTGDMVVGNMGAENKMDYTIMGNAVNLAARLESVNNQYHTGGILISEYTRNKIGDEFLLRRLDRVRVVGIDTPLRLYELLGMNDENGKMDNWEKAMDFYEERKFNDAGRLFFSIMKSNPSDKTAEMYVERCKACIQNPPPLNWDAVRNLTEK
ncbi:MAG: adenylate/guanylate cyclase domain-containing protein [Treponema sp.]|jgi:adenylate cyclase|nr:adenylate/guanylate cyclase domain-containing protein [Treponema sp.]